MKPNSTALSALLARDISPIHDRTANAPAVQRRINECESDIRQQIVLLS